MKPIITTHGKKRLKERVGLCKRSHIRHIQNVLKKGCFLFRDKQGRTFHMHFSNYEYVFGWTQALQPILVTVVHPYANKHMYEKERHDASASRTA